LSRMSIVSPSPATDVHQHLWTEPFVAALARRRTGPSIHAVDGGWAVRVPGEPDSRFALSAHDPRRRAEELRASGLERALLSMSTPLGVEALPEDEARPVLDAWHEGAFAAGPAFGVWGAVPVQGATPADVDALLARGAVGLSLPAALLAGPEAIEAAGPLLARLEARDAPLFVHPGPATPAQATTATAAHPPWWPALTTYVADMHVAWHAFAGWGRAAHPRLRICFAMLAGLAPLHAGRLALRGGPVEAPRDPGCFYDISSYSSQAIEAVAAEVGVEQLVTGTDRPVVDPPSRSPLGDAAAVLTATTNVHRLLQGSTT
jgi:hypothetical protein